MDSHVLFPVRLDDFLFNGWDHERKPDVMKKVVADATGWDQNPAVYRRILDRLLRDLKTGQTPPLTTAKVWQHETLSKETPTPQ